MGPGRLSGGGGGEGRGGGVKGLDVVGEVRIRMQGVKGVKVGRKG